MFRRCKRTAILMLVLGILILPGCGGGDGDRPLSLPTPGSETASEPVEESETSGAESEITSLGSQYKTPVLKSAEANGTNYLLTWSQPGRRFPSGGYDLIIDGIDTEAAHRTDQLEATVSGLSMGEEHCFQVQANFLQARREYFPTSDEICVSPPSAPAPEPDPIYNAPTLEPVQINGTSFILNWSQPGETPSGGFDLIIDGIDTGTEHRTTERIAVISGLDAGAEHCFQVQAQFLQADPAQFPESNETCTPPVSQPEPEPEPAPTYAAPVLNPVEVNGTSYILAWTQEGESPSGGYDLFIDGIDTGATDRTFDTSAVLSGLAAGMEHCFHVEGRFLQADPDQFHVSNPQCITVPGGDTIAPSAPKGVTATALSPTEARLDWSAALDDIGVAGYHIYRDGTVVGTTAETSYSDTDLTSGRSYSYTVAAFDAAGNESAHSVAAKVTTSAGNIYRVGPGRTYKTLQEVQNRLQPGDLVLVDGNTVYPGGVTFSNAGTADRKITIRGDKSAGSRPVIEGGYNGVEFNRNHYVFEGFEIRNATSRGLFHHAHDITIRDCIVHHCPNGILGADQGSGSLTVEYCEVYACGSGTNRHQLYIATNEIDYPGSVFRLQFSFLHDAAGGHNVKSRAERNEIYFNWIDNAMYHNLELIGPDPSGGVAEGVKREDSDVVGNVLIARRYGRNVRIGGDGTGQSNGRYRFVNNTFIHRYSSPRSHIFAHFGVESVEMHNNIFHIPSYNVFDDSEAAWVFGRRVSGSNNWAHSGAGIPSEWTGTLRGTDPGLVDWMNDKLRPVAGSAVLDRGAQGTSGPSESAFPNPLVSVTHHPPEGELIPVGTAEKRLSNGGIDLGAFELQ